jgi:phosphoacetylglucosamine mutase
MDLKLITTLTDASSKFPKPVGFKPSYGTAGFRALGTDMGSTVFRCGLLLAIRAMQVGQKTGICITASHNPEQDNGVKLVEPTGDMLTQDWEGIADQLANAATPDALIAVVQSLIADNAVNLAAPQEVIVAHDTRATSPELAVAAAAGIEALGCTATLLGLLTTPQLHWIVMRRNQGEPAGESDYYDMLVHAFGALVKDAPATDKVCGYYNAAIVQYKVTV